MKYISKCITAIAMLITVMLVAIMLLGGYLIVNAITHYLLSGTSDTIQYFLLLCLAILLSTLTICVISFLILSCLMHLVDLTIKFIKR